MYVRHRVSLLLSVAFCAVAAPVLCLAQATTGSVSGQVTDPSGSAIQGAKVSITNVDEGLITTASTSSSGSFTQTALPPAHYTITVEAPGFSTVSVPRFTLDIDQRARFNLKLNLGSVNTDVTVTDTAPELQSQGAETGQVIGAREIEDLPIEGRDFRGLLLLTPGVVSGGGGNNINLSVNGQREFSNSIQVNGVEVTGVNNDTNVRPSPDALQEFKVVTSTYAPEFGRAAGGAVVLQTKAGTNNVHGSGYFFYRPTATAATGPFATPDSVPTLTQKIYGGTIGGPILKNKAFLFLSFEGNRSRDTAFYAGQTAPTNQINYLPNGDVDLSGLKDPNTGNQIPIFDPFFFQQNFYSQQFAGNVIPAAMVSPAGKRILQQLFPAPNNDTGVYSNFNVAQPILNNSNVGNFRADYTFSQNNRFYLTYDSEQGDNTTGDPYGGSIPIAGGGGADSGGYQSYENHVVGLTYDHVFTPTLLNEARISYFLTTGTQSSLVDGTNLATQFGIQNANIPGFPQTFGFPQIQFQSGPTTGGSTYKPLTGREVRLGFVDAVTYTRGTHNAKLGYEYRNINSHPSFSLFPVPYLYFGGPGAALTSDPYYGFYDPNAFYYNGGSEVADLLLGLPLVAEQGLQLSTPHTQANEHTFYLQDYWQVTKRINVTYGVRYEYLQPFVESKDQMSNFNLDTLQLDLAGTSGTPRSLVYSNLGNIMPRVGIDFLLKPGTVVRGGFGIFYSQENDSRDVIGTENYPFFTQQQFTNSVYDSSFAYQLDQGMPRTTKIPVAAGTTSIDPMTIPGSSVYTFSSQPKSFPAGFTKSYNVSLQQEVGKATTFEIGFVGANGRNLSYEVGDYNLGKRLSPNLGKIQTLLPIGLSNYSSLQAKLTRRFTSGYSVIAAYTWSHSLDNGEAPRDLSGGNGTQLPQNPFDIGAEYANSDNDVRNNVTASQIIELPFGRGKRFLHDSGNLTDILIGGWQVNSITTLHGGSPFNVVASGTDPNYPGIRPNLVGNPYVAHRTRFEWFNPAAFAAPPQPKNGPIVFGNAPRNFLYGPGFTNEDVSLFKVLNLPREMRLQVRIEAFNVLNTAHYDNPVSSLAQGRIGEIVGGGSPRVMQFAGRLTF